MAAALGAPGILIAGVIGVARGTPAVLVARQLSPWHGAKVHIRVGLSAAAAHSRALTGGIWWVGPHQIACHGDHSGWQLQQLVTGTRVLLASIGKTDDGQSCRVWPFYPGRRSRPVLLAVRTPWNRPWACIQYNDRGFPVRRVNGRGTISACPLGDGMGWFGLVEHAGTRFTTTTLLTDPLGRVRRGTPITHVARL